MVEDVTKTELALLRVLWERGAATVRVLTEALYARAEAAQVATVQKLLERLRAKGYVTRDTGGRAHVYAAAIGRDELIRHRLRQTAQDLCDSHMTPLLTQLVHTVQPSSKELRDLRSLLDALEREAE